MTLFLRKLLAVIVIALVSAVSVSVVQAHAGGTPRIVNEPSGDFVVSVWTLPDPISSNTESNFIVFVADGEDFSQSRAAVPVLGADIELTFSNGTDVLTFLATHASATNKLFYESYLMLPNEGTWTVDVVVSHAGKFGEAQFSLDVIESEPEINWLLYGGIGIVVIAVGWFVWQSREEEDEEA